MTPKQKLSNPKDAIGSNKLPYHLWPETATVLGVIAMTYGAVQYGRSNYRAVGVRASIYYDACRRHLNAWFEGEDLDPDSGLPHLGHALACLAILVDAGACAKLNDDRMVRGGYRQLIDAMTAHVPRLKAKYADKAPHHFSIADSARLLDEDRHAIRRPSQRSSKRTRQSPRVLRPHGRKSPRAH